MAEVTGVKADGGNNNFSMIFRNCEDSIKELIPMYVELPQYYMMTQEKIGRKTVT